MKTLLLAAALAVASVATVSAEGFPNPYATNSDVGR